MHIVSHTSLDGDKFFGYIIKRAVGDARYLTRNSIWVGNKKDSRIFKTLPEADAFVQTVGNFNR